MSDISREFVKSSCIQIVVLATLIAIVDMLSWWLYESGRLFFHSMESYNGAPYVVGFLLWLMGASVLYVHAYNFIQSCSFSSLNWRQIITTILRCLSLAFCMLGFKAKHESVVCGLEFDDPYFCVHMFGCGHFYIINLGLSLLLVDVNF